MMAAAERCQDRQAVAGLVCGAGAGDTGRVEEARRYTATGRGGTACQPFH